jgi:hypothetical protein
MTPKLYSIPMGVLTAVYVFGGVPLHAATKPQADGCKIQSLSLVATTMERGRRPVDGLHPTHELRAKLRDGGSATLRLHDETPLDGLTTSLLALKLIESKLASGRNDTAAETAMLKKALIGLTRTLSQYFYFSTYDSRPIRGALILLGSGDPITQTDQVEKIRSALRAILKSDLPTMRDMPKRVLGDDTLTATIDVDGAQPDTCSSVSGYLHQGRARHRGVVVCGELPGLASDARPCASAGSLIASLVSAEGVLCDQLVTPASQSSCGKTTFDVATSTVTPPASKLGKIPQRPAAERAQ